jgi:ABC-type nitrate/sulfonate/bicarbonate transport system permease component
MTQATSAGRDIFGGVQLNQLQRNVLALVSIVFCIAIWWLITGTGMVGKVLLPSPAEVAETMFHSMADGSLVKHTTISLLRVGQGFVLAMLVAVPMGMLMGSSQIARGLIEPIVELLRPVPPIAMIPLAILWFGIDELSKVLIIAYGAFFPILLNTMAGFRDVDRTHIRAAQTLGATRLQIFRDVILRSAFPLIVVGARLGMGMAFIVLVAAELIASSAGLGYLINDGRYSFRTEQIFMGMVSIGILGFLLNKGLLLAESRLLKWKQVHH